MLTNKGLILKDISFSYKEGVQVLQNINVHLHPSTITALVGENGCGKTTLLRILSGMTKPTSGEFLFDGCLITEKSLEQYKLGLGYMPEQLTLYPDEKVYNVLQFFSVLRQQKKTKDELLNILDLVGLLAHKNKKVSALSKGLKQRLNFAQAIIHEPKVAIFDEPSNGFDYIGVDIFYKTIKKLSESGAVVIMTSHLFSELWGKVDNILFLKYGKIENIFAAKFGAVKEASNKILFLRLDEIVGDEFFSKASSLFPNLLRLDIDTLKAELSIEQILSLLSIVKEFKLNIRDLQVDSMDIELMLKRGVS
jgi:Cu-processing system ATP-binding protein